MSELEQAQLRLAAKRKKLGITASTSLDTRSWAEARIDEFRKANPHLDLGPRRGRKVRCVECGHESQVETNRRRRLRTLKCRADSNSPEEFCGGRLRPLNWFRVSSDES